MDEELEEKIVNYLDSLGQRAPLERILLYSLLGASAAGAVSLSALVPGLAKLFSRRGRKYNYWSLRRSLKNLQKKGLVAVDQRNGEEYLQTTDKVSFESRGIFQENALGEVKIRKSKAWDGKWRVVIFDVPEKLRKARDRFNRKLKQLGFICIQRSVFVYPFPCEPEVIKTAEILEVNTYVQIFEAKFLSNDYLLKKKFSL